MQRVLGICAVLLTISSAAWAGPEEDHRFRSASIRGFSKRS